jgi:tetratricopeptide (TPR) repeat protein
VFRPRRAADWFALGEQRMARGDAQGAIEAYLKAAGTLDGPFVAPASVRIGLYQKRQGDLRRAGLSFERARLSKHPDYGPRGAFHLAGLYAQQGDARRAVELYGEVVESGHADVGPHATLCLAELHEDRDELERAAELYDAAFRTRHPDVAGKAAYSLASLRERLGDVGAAMAGYRAAVTSGDPEAAGLGRAALRRLGAGDSRADDADATVTGDYSLATTRNGERGFRFHDPVQGAAIAADSGLVEAMLAKHNLWHLVGMPYFGYPEDSGYVISFGQNVQ